jgi:hypothetical protein
MQFMLQIIGFTDDTGGATVEEFMAYDTSMVEAGVKVDGAPLGDYQQAASVQVGTDGQPTITNGLFSGTTEFLGGYIILEVPDLDAALDWAGRCPGAKYGRVEVRPIMRF